MAHESLPQPNTSPEDVMRALDAVAQHGQRRIVRVRGQAVALVPQAEPETDDARHLQGLTRASALWSVVGAITDPSGSTDIATNKHQYLTEAYLDNDT